MSTKPKSALQLHQVNQGLRLLTMPITSVPSVAVMVLAGVGSRHESLQQSGISHFFEHMAFKGTTLRPSSLDIAAAIDGIGGEFNAFTGKEYTGYYIKAAAKDLPLCIDVLSDILFHSTLNAEELDRERGVILEEMNMYLDTPTDRVGELYSQLLYPKQPLGQDIIGTKKSLQKLQRADLDAFAQQWYVPNNLVVSVAGNFDAGKSISTLESSFTQRTPQVLPQAVPAQVAQQQAQLNIHTKKTDQTHMVLGVRGYHQTHPQRYALMLLNIILGGNMSSRLFVEVREKRGLAYAVSTNTEEYADVGSLNCQVGLDHSRIAEAITVILEQFTLLKQKSVSETELQRAKNYVRGKLALSLEDPLSLDIFYSRQWLLEGKIQHPDQIMAEVDAVTADQIQAVAQELFVSSSLNLALITPKADTEHIQALLKV